MTTKAKSNIARIAIALLSGLFPQVTFNMKRYNMQPSGNGFRPDELNNNLDNLHQNSACFFGFGPLVLGPTDARFWTDYRRDICEAREDRASEEVCDFLASSEWGNCDLTCGRQQAARRALFAIQHPEYARTGVISAYPIYYSNKSDEEILKLLGYYVETE